MAPSSYIPMDALGRPGGTGTMISAPTSGVRETQNALADFLPEPRKRKIDEVDGHQADERVRLGLHFQPEGGGSSISPTSYRTYSDFPRSSYPPQMPAPATTGHCQLGSSNEKGVSMNVRTVGEGQMLDHLKDHAALSSVDRAAGPELGVRGYRPVRGRVRHLRRHVDGPRTYW